MPFVFNDKQNRQVEVPDDVSHVTVQLVGGGPGDGSFLNVQVVRDGPVNYGPRRVVTVPEIQAGRVAAYAWDGFGRITCDRFGEVAGEGERIDKLLHGWVLNYRWRGWFASMDDAARACQRET